MPPSRLSAPFSGPNSTDTSTWASVASGANPVSLCESWDSNPNGLVAHRILSSERPSRYAPFGCASPPVRPQVVEVRGQERAARDRTAPETSTDASTWSRR